MERRANRFGTLVSKGEGKPWLAKWVCNGKVFYKSTGEVDKKKAYKVLEKLTRPYREESNEAIIENLKLQIKRLEESSCGKKLMTKDIWNEFEKTLWQSNAEKNTLSNYEGCVKHMQAWMIGKSQDARGIDKKLCELYLKSLAESVGEGTYNLKLSVLKRVWKTLAPEFKLDASLWDSFKKRKMPKSMRKPLSVDELGKLVAKADTQDLRVLVLVGAYTGLRISDCASLKWSNVDFEKNVVSVVPQKTKKHMSGPVVIPMHKVLRDELEKMDNSSEHVSEHNAKMYAHGMLKNEVAALFKKCGIATTAEVDGKKKIVSGFHALRHTFVSMAVNNGMSPLLVQRIVGHSSVNMTEAYFHDNIDKMAEGVSTLPDIVKIA